MNPSSKGEFGQASSDMLNCIQYLMKFLIDRKRNSEYYKKIRNTYFEKNGRDVHIFRHNM